MLSVTTLANELNKIEPAGDELQAASAWADAFLIYLSDAAGGVIPAVKPAITNLKSLMVTALLGMSIPVIGPLQIQKGIIAVWTALIPMTSAVFPGTIPPLTPPLGNAGISVALLGAAATNVIGNLPRKEAAANLAAAIHATQIAGGLVTLIGPPPVTAPIL